MVVIRCQGDQAQGGWRCTFWMVGSNQVHSWCSLPNQTELGDCLDCIVWNTDAQRLFLNWYMKCIRFPSGTGNAGLAIIPTNYGCLRCHRPCFKSRVDLWYLASTALVKSSLFLLLLPSALCVLVLMVVLDHGPRTPPGKLQALSSVWKHSPVSKILLDRRCHTEISRKASYCISKYFRS